jgi:hypothetical protein
MILTRVVSYAFRVTGSTIFFLLNSQRISHMPYSNTLLLQYISLPVPHE